MRIVIAMSALALAALLSGWALAAEPDCFEKLTNGVGGEIACEFPTRMSASERAEAEKVTRGLLKDAACVVAIKIARALVDEALAAPAEHIFQAPPQQAKCTVTTSSAALPITLTFSPRVVFKDGVAIEASPRMGNVTGVPKALWWPVAYWLNSADMIEEPMLEIVNAFKGRQREKAAAD